MSVEFIGTVHRAFRDEVEAQPEMKRVVKFTPHLSHSELLARYGDTDLQLLVLAHTILAPGNLPGKFFEYLASGNFILGIGPVNGDAATIIKNTGSGIMIDRGDIGAIKAAIKNQFDLWRSRSPRNAADVSAFDRKMLTRKLSDLLETFVS